MRYCRYPKVETRISGSCSTTNLKAGTMTRIIHMLCEATNGYIFWKRGNNDCEFWEELLTPMSGRSTQSLTRRSDFDVIFGIEPADEAVDKQTEKHLWRHARNNNKYVFSTNHFAVRQCLHLIWPIKRRVRCLHTIHKHSQFWILKFPDAQFKIIF